MEDDHITPDRGRAEDYNRVLGPHREEMLGAETLPCRAFAECKPGLSSFAISIKAHSPTDIGRWFWKAVHSFALGSYYAAFSRRPRP